MLWFPNGFFCTFDLKSFRTEFLGLSIILFWFRMGFLVLLEEIIVGFRKAFFLASERNYFWLPNGITLGFQFESFRAPQWNHFRLLNEIVLGLQISKQYRTKSFWASVKNSFGLPTEILLDFFFFDFLIEFIRTCGRNHFGLPEKESFILPNGIDLGLRNKFFRAIKSIPFCLLNRFCFCASEFFPTENSYLGFRAELIWTSESKLFWVSEKNYFGPSNGNILGFWKDLF